MLKKAYIVTTGAPILTPDQCDELIRVGQSEPHLNATIGMGDKTTRLDSKYRKSIISWIPFVKAEPIYAMINQWMEATNSNCFGFDAVRVIEKAQYAEYSEGGFYNWHMDSTIGMAAMSTVRKISMTLLLNDPKDFEGGGLEIYNGDALDSEKNKFKIKRGYAIFFASFLLHRVTPIIKGNRKALVMWFGGPPLR